MASTIGKDLDSTSGEANTSEAIILGERFTPETLIPIKTKPPLPHTIATQTLDKKPKRPSSAPPSSQLSKYDLARSGVVEGNRFICPPTPSVPGKSGQGTFRKLLSSGTCEIDLTRLSLDEFYELAKGLVQAKNIERIRLRCRHKVLTAESARDSTRHGKHARAVESVAKKFETTMVGSQLSKAIAKVIRQHPSKSIDIPLGSGRKSRGLKELELGCSVGIHGLARIGSAINLSNSLTRLNLTGARIGDAGFKVLVFGIRQNPIISELILSCCRLSDATAEPLATILKSHASHLAIAHWQDHLREYNGNAAASQLGDAFARDETASVKSRASNAKGLALLDISNNMFTDHGLSIMCATLEQDELLQTFIVGGNKFSPAGFSQLHSIELNRIPRVTVEYDENDDDKIREKELAKHRLFMASTIARIKTHTSSEQDNNIMNNAENRGHLLDNSNKVSMDLPSRPRWRTGTGKISPNPKRVNVMDPRISIPKDKNCTKPKQITERTNPNIQKKSSTSSKKKGKKASKPDAKSLETMMEDMTTLLTKLESSVETLNLKKNRKKDMNKDSKRDRKEKAIDSDTIAKLNSELKALYDLSY